MESAKEYLKEMERMDNAIDRLLAIRSSLFDKATHITPTLKQDVVSSGGTCQDLVGNISAKIVDLEKEIDRLTDLFYDRKCEVATLLGEVFKISKKQHDLLKMKYLEGKRLPQIAIEMGYEDVDGANKLHGRALETFDRIMKERKEEGA